MLSQADATTMTVTKYTKNSTILNEWSLEGETRITANTIMINWIYSYQKINKIPEKFQIFDFLEKKSLKPKVIELAIFLI